MKLSDYVVQFWKDKGVDTVFGYQGSSVSHTIDSISRSSLRFVETRHEQAAAFAACGYAMAKSAPAVALSCSGPGAINLLNGVADAWYDSLMCFFLTGQVSTSGIRESGQEIRQLGFQETDIVKIAEPLTKYAVTVFDPLTIRMHLERAWDEMTTGRPGPVLLDIPHNVQTAQVDPNVLKGYESKKNVARPNDAAMERVITLLRNASRPLLLLGGGAHNIRNKEVLKNICTRLQLPVVCSYLGKDVLDHDDEHFIGVIGAYGSRAGNFSVHYCDLLVSLGSRMDGRQTGDNPEGFAPSAQIVQVDIDPAELAAKPERYIKIESSVESFTENLEKRLKFSKEHSEWLETVQKWRYRFAPEAEYPTKEPGVNPNFLLNQIGRSAPGAMITLDVGQNQIWANTSLHLLQDAQLLQSGGLGAMGFALPAAIGAGCAFPERKLVCICGDGGFQMNLQELQTVATQKIPVHIYVLNNRSLGLIRVYQQKALEGNLEGSVIGFGCPDLKQLALAYELPYFHIGENDEWDNRQREIAACKGPCLIEICVSDKSPCYPEPSYRQSVEKQSPLMSEVLQEQLKREVYGTQTN
ncbi:thiamine pyrophosphate-binding protein [Pygmaiobacter massiliensis]|uniref:thiamine pyrophosphate-binding protein n=1 Tax=Pygmaiobacter massiliensis TaxID=1917873 RepID=UPI002A7FC9DC|nr:thiamine pyrophosphate-binding protein [Pygmaiobacter massiliensis]MDY4784954.1 thiamine pyrophosphate-binding protein [Pygmaiobacter massiliensis]